MLDIYIWRQGLQRFALFSYSFYFLFLWSYINIIYFLCQYNILHIFEFITYIYCFQFFHFINLLTILIIRFTKTFLFFILSKYLYQKSLIPSIFYEVLSHPIFFLLFKLTTYKTTAKHVIVHRLQCPVLLYIKCYTRTVYCWG